MAGFVGLGGTSMIRPFTPYGQKQGRDYHSAQHNCCILGRDHRVKNATSYINSKVPLKVASIPGLSLQNWDIWRSPDAPYKGKLLYQFVDWVCQQEGFSGILALFLLCNDEEFFKKPKIFDARIVLRKYLDLLQTYLEKTLSLARVKLLVLNTTVFRQSDFVNSHPSEGMHYSHIAR